MLERTKGAVFIGFGKDQKKSDLIGGVGWGGVEVMPASEVCRKSL